MGVALQYVFQAPRPLPPVALPSSKNSAFSLQVGEERQSMACGRLLLARPGSGTFAHIPQATASKRKGGWEMC